MIDREALILRQCKALGEAQRWNMLELLHKPTTVTVLAQIMGIRQSVVSHHLQILLDVKLVTYLSSGQYKLYQTREQELSGISVMIENLATFKKDSSNETI